MPDMEELIRDFLWTNRTGRWVDQSKEGIDRDKVPGVANEIQTDLSRSVDDRKWNSDYVRRHKGKLVITSTVLIGIIIGLLDVSPVCGLIGIVGKSCTAFLRWANLQGTYAETIFRLGITIMACAAFGVAYQIVWKRAPPSPRHASTIGVILGTAGDGHVEIGYITDGIELPTLADHLKRLNIKTKKDTRTFAGLLDITTHEVQTGEYVPHVYRIEFTESQPFDSLALGTPTRTLLKGNDDSGLPLNGVIKCLVNSSLPALVQVTVSGRYSDGDRANKILDDVSSTAGASLSDAAWYTGGTVSGDGLVESTQSSHQQHTTANNMTEHSLTDVADVTVRIVVFEPTDTVAARGGTSGRTGKFNMSADRLSQTIADRIGAPTNDCIEEVTARDNSEDQFTVVSRGGAGRVLSGLNENRVAFRGAYRLYGRLARLNLHSRTAYQVTPEELLNYLAVSGDASEKAQRGQNATALDQTDTSGPNEGQLEEFRPESSLTEGTKPTDPTRSSTSNDQ